ncbi:hypothetical protein PV325_013110 [Microctonus aethiopoides]|uniref:Arf-GAP domain-containing protein n=1 Tax=Microctonus aethiopoides TaxID=144406 RepID=A0AA39FM14_9HYME|nr:hypothetical protein PV325_013110 [Microctonus aethiopoides]KAK0091372.1 hypothetical protein PV326_003321 [Microctonus aethiopoides]KAK0171891.1 hypothetical protein PV328_005283 [Microctonus aethiopoides]
MASMKRKQDEKHLKILRELVSQSGNKECFDCRQRGPTYVNMTIGSFVCTSCSGMLRGLTPPHRVKSISMATFTADEIEFIKERGNEYCRRIWLGLMNSNHPLTIDTKDEQKMKDLMSAKYEYKRYYLDPSMANDNDNQKIPQSSNNLRSSAVNQTNIPRVPQVGTFPTLNTPNQKKKNISQPIENSFTPDFVADFSQVPDPFVAATPTSKFPGTVEPQQSFANFDNNPAFDIVNNTTSFNQIAVPTMSNVNGINAPPSEDRYAALKDLDSMMKKTQLNDDTSTNVSSPWITNNSNTSSSLWPHNEQTSHVISNPFTAVNDLWRPSLHVMNNNNVQPLDNNFCNTANPFRQSQFPVNNESQWISFGSQNTTDVLPSSQMMTPLSGKVWHPTVPPYQANPFMVGTGGGGHPARNSNNPFL